MSYLDLINIKYSIKLVFWVFIIVFLCLAIYILNLNIYESYSSYGYVKYNKIITKIPINTPDIINNFEYIKIGNKDYPLKSVEVVDASLDEENFINYNIVKLEINDSLINNEAIVLDIFYNKEKVYKKIKKILF